MTDEDDFNAMVQLSDVGLKENKAPTNEFWFNRTRQKQEILDVAKRLYTNDEMTPDEAIDQAEDLIQCYYDRIIRWDNK